MNDLAKKIAHEWLASKVIQSSVRVKSMPGSYPRGARSNGKYAVTLNGATHDLIAKHDRGTWGHHTYQLILDGTPIGWLSKHSVMNRDSSGEMEHDYYEYTITNAKKRPVITDAEGSEDKLLGKALEMMSRRGDLD